MTKRKKIFTLVLISLITIFIGVDCRKQPKCGCGKDVIFTLTDSPVNLQYNESSNTIFFYPVIYNGSTYYLCNPSKWMDSVKKLNIKEPLLVSGDVFYECNYLYQSGNYYYQLPPVYQVIVTSIKEDNYGK